MIRFLRRKIMSFVHFMKEGKKVFVKIVGLIGKNGCPEHLFKQKVEELSSASKTKAMLILNRFGIEEGEQLSFGDTQIMADYISTLSENERYCLVSESTYGRRIRNPFAWQGTYGFQRA
jgi:hypothetical protein